MKIKSRAIAVSAAVLLSVSAAAPVCAADGTVRVQDGTAVVGESKEITAQINGDKVVFVFKGTGKEEKYTALILDENGNIKDRLSPDTKTLTVSYPLSYLTAGKSYRVYMVPSEAADANVSYDIISKFPSASFTVPVKTESGTSSDSGSTKKSKEIVCTIEEDVLTVSWSGAAVASSDRAVYSVSIINGKKESVYSCETYSRSISVRGLQDGKKYTVKVYNKTTGTVEKKSFTFRKAKKTSMGAADDSAPFSAGSYAAADSGRLSAPANLKARAGTDCAILSWSKVNGADSYRVYIYDSDTASFVYRGTVKGTSCTVKNLAGGVSRRFKVCALKYDRNTGKYIQGYESAEVSCTPSGRVMPPSPRY